MYSIESELSGPTLIFKECFVFLEAWLQYSRRILVTGSSKEEFRKEKKKMTKKAAIIRKQEKM